MGAPLVEAPRPMRLSEAARRLLSYLDQDGARLIFLPTHGRFYFHLGATVEPIRQLTVNALVRPGLIVRDKATALPVYHISGKGRRLLSVLRARSQAMVQRQLDLEG